MIRAADPIDLYNAAADLLGRQSQLGTLDKVAVYDETGAHTYAALIASTNRFANLLAAHEVGAGERAMLCLDDSVDFFTCFLGAIRAGVIPVPVNTLLTASDYASLLEDSGATFLVVSQRLLPLFAGPVEASVRLRRVVVAGCDASTPDCLASVLAGLSDECPSASTRAADIAFWLYTSGTTGKPKGVMHRQASLVATADRFARHVLQLERDDIIFSPPKLFFAYGLGNSLTFPLSVGATALLLAGRPRPESIHALTRDHPPTVFFGVPTLYAMMLNAGQYPSLERLRICVSAGEALPRALLERWRRVTGIDILDGLGSTEMLNTFVSNRIGDNRPGTSGKPVPGYRVSLRANGNREAEVGEVGDLYVSGPSAAAGYWQRPESTRETFKGGWVHTRDKYVRDADGYYTHCGRADDMLKVGGVYVAPAEVEDALLSHPFVAEAAVVGAMDRDALIKPKAFVVPARGVRGSAALEETLIEYVRDRLAAYKRPRWVEFVPTLPKTATGKLQRYKLR